MRLKQAWRDGTTRLVFEPLDFLGKLAALTPRPAINLLCYHGVLAPHARWRRQVVAYGRAASEAGALRPAKAGLARSEAGAPHPPRNWSWAALMRRAFGLDVLACPRCGARRRVLATIARIPSWCAGSWAPSVCPVPPRPSARAHPLLFPPGRSDLISQRGTAIPRAPEGPGPESAPSRRL